MFFLNLGECINYSKVPGGSKGFYMSNALRDFSLQEISWGNFRDLLVKRPIDLYFSQSIFKFIFFLIEQNLYLGDFKEELVKNKETVLRYASSISKKFQEIHFGLDGFSPSSILFYNHKENSEVVIVLFPREKLNVIFNEYLNEFDSIVNNITKYKNDKLFFEHFTRSLGTFEINTINDFNDSTFIEQIKYFVQLDSRETLGYLMKFYAYIYKKINSQNMETNFTLVNDSLLGYIPVSRLLLEGYEIIFYDPYLKILPRCKKYIIQDNGFNNLKSYSNDKPFVFDPDFIANVTLRDIYFNYAWNMDNSLSQRSKSLIYVRELLVVWDSKVLPDSIVKSISLDIIETYKKNSYEKKISKNSLSKRFSITRKFLRYLKESNIIECDELTLDMFSTSEESRVLQTAKYSVHDLLTIMHSIDIKLENLEKDKSRFLHYVHLKNIIAIISVSEIRLEGLLDMKVSDILIEEGKFHKAKFRSKLVLEKKNISKVCNSFFQDSIEQSSKVRLEIRSQVSDFIFIHLKRARGIPTIISSENLNTTLKEICISSGVNYVGMKGFRKLFNHQVTEFVKGIKNSELKIAILTGHSPQVHYTNYINHKVREHMQFVFKSFIGDMQTTGEVKNLNSEVSNISNTVKKGLGFCKSEKCIQLGKLDCLMCKSFLVTPQCKPFFEKAINEIDIKIMEEPLYHAKELLHLEKRLLVLYLTTIIEVSTKKEKIYGTN